MLPLYTATATCRKTFGLNHQAKLGINMPHIFGILLALI
jgi:hypothetical protein